MPAPAVRLVDDDEIVLRGSGVRFPVELRPQGFLPDDPATWPTGDGRFEFVEGRLLYMPPCADIQQDVAADVVYVLRAWAETRQDFVVGGNEAGMKLGGDIRGADAAVWRRADLGRPTGHFRTVAPVLAVEVAGEDEEEPVLREKARWYVGHGVGVVWLLFPAAREVIVVTERGEERFGHGARLAMDARLPDLVVDVERLFAQLDRAAR